MTASATALLPAPHAICASVARAAAARAPARATATEPSTPVTASNAMAPATTTHGTSAFAPSLRSRRSAPSAANTAYTNDTTKLDIPPAPVFLPLVVTDHQN